MRTEICCRIVEGPENQAECFEVNALNLAPSADAPSLFSGMSCSFQLKWSHRYENAFWTGMLSPERMGMCSGVGSPALPATLHGNDWEKPQMLLVSWLVLPGKQSKWFCRAGLIFETEGKQEPSPVLPPGLKVQSPPFPPPSPLAEPRTAREHHPSLKLFLSSSSSYLFPSTW